MAEPDGGASDRGTTVLICDDAAAMRSLLRIVVGLREGMSVAGEAANGHEAIAQAGLLQPDVILLDLSMPHGTGFEALPEINRVAPKAKVVILSGFAISVIERDLLGESVVDYLQKGAEPDEILAAIEAAASGRAGA